MEKKKENIFDFKLFKRLFQYIKPYKGVFFGLILLVILLAGLSASTPYITKFAIDDSIASKESKDFLFYILVLLAVLMMQTVFQLSFIYYAAFLGQNLVMDVRVKLFVPICLIIGTYLWTCCLQAVCDKGEIINSPTH